MTAATKSVVALKSTYTTDYTPIRRLFLSYARARTNTDKQESDTFRIATNKLLLSPFAPSSLSVIAHSLAHSQALNLTTLRVDTWQNTIRHRQKTHDAHTHANMGYVAVNVQ